MFDLLLGYLVVASSGVSKLPQIRAVASTGVIKGLSRTGILLELYCHSLNTGFFILDSYPLMNYLEYPLLVLQNLFLLYLVGSVTENTAKHLLIILGFILFISVTALGFLAKPLVLAALSLNSPIGVSAKVAQINAIREAGNSQSVSYSFYVINLGTGAARIYTNLLLPAWEPLVVFNLAAMMAANISVITTIFLYRVKIKTN